MTCVFPEEVAEPEQPRTAEDAVVRRDGVFRSLLRGLFWPFSLVVRTYRGFWWVLGYRQSQEKAVVGPAASSPAHQSVSSRKRLHRVTRFLLSMLPRWVRGALGYPVSSSIGRSLSPEIRVSPTKPCGKGSKRKQDELDDEDDDDDEEEEEAQEQSQTWVEVLNQELADDESPEQDPDYEPSTVETESEEYCSHNNTESDIEVQEKGVVIKDVNTGIEVSSPTEVSRPAL